MTIALICFQRCREEV